MGSCFSKDTAADNPDQSKDQYKTNEEPSSSSGGGGGPIGGGKAHAVSPHNDIVWDIVCLPRTDYQRALITASGDDDKNIVVYNWDTQTTIARLTGHTRGVTKLAISPLISHRITLFSTSRDLDIRQWVLADRAGSTCQPQAGSVGTYKGHEMAATALAVVAVEDTDDTDDDDDDDRDRDRDQGTPDADSRRSVLCTGGRDGTVRFWDVDVGFEARKQEISRNMVTCIAPVGRGTDTIIQCSEDLQIRFWSVHTGTVTGSIKRPPDMDHFPKCCAAGAADSDVFVTGHNGFDGSGCEIRQWSISQGACIQVMRGHTEAVHGICILPFTAGDVVVSVSKDARVRVHCLESGRELSMSTLSQCGQLMSVCGALREDGTSADVFIASFNGHVLRLQVDSDGKQTVVTTLSPSDG